METRANYVLIGLFTLAVVVAGFGFVYWFSRSGEIGQRMAFRVIFDGSVSGLRTGNAVLFNGIRVGEVTELGLPGDPRQVIALIAVDRRTPVRTDTRVTLEYQGLTGNASVALRGGTADSPALVAKAQGEIPTLMAEPTAGQDLTQGVRDLMARGDSILRRVDNFLAENEAGLRNSVKNLDAFTAALGRNADNIDAVLQNGGDMFRKLGTTAERIDGFVQRLDKFVADNGDSAGNAIRNVAELTRRLDEFVAENEAAAGSTLRNLNEFSTALARNSDSIDNILKNGGDLVSRLSETSQRLDAFVRRVDGFVADNQGSASNAIRNFDTFSASLARNGDNVDGILRNASELSQKLNDMAPKLEAALTGIANMTGSEEGKGAFAKIADAAEAVRRFADNLDRRTEQLAIDGRRALNDLGRAVRNFDRNPSRVITGGGSGGIPDYSGRR